SSMPYFCIPTKSACPRRGRVSGELRAPVSSSGSTGSAAITFCHLGHSVFPTSMAMGDPMVMPWRIPPMKRTSSCSNDMRAPRPCPRRRRARVACTSGVVISTPAGSPSSTPTSEGPCDSPAVIQRMFRSFHYWFGGWLTGPSPWRFLVGVCVVWGGFFVVCVCFLSFFVGVFVCVFFALRCVLGLVAGDVELGLVFVFGCFFG